MKAVRSAKLTTMMFAGMIASCSSSVAPEVQVDTRTDGFDLRLRIKAVRDLCYAPTLLQTNPNLFLDGFKAVNEVAVVRAPPSKIDGLSEILASKRAQLNDISIFIGRDEVLQPAFHLQFPAFPCDAPRTATPNVSGLHIVNVSVDLPMWSEKRQVGHRFTF